jgi:hypothetical protein
MPFIKSLSAATAALMSQKAIFFTLQAAIAYPDPALLLVAYHKEGFSLPFA